MIFAEVLLKPIEFLANPNKKIGNNLSEQQHIESSELNYDDMPLEKLFLVKRNNLI